MTGLDLSTGWKQTWQSIILVIFHTGSGGMGRPPNRVVRHRGVTNLPSTGLTSGRAAGNPSPSHQGRTRPVQSGGTAGEMSAGRRSSLP